jgi:hypothetical protein
MHIIFYIMDNGSEALKQALAVLQRHYGITTTVQYGNCFAMRHDQLKKHPAILEETSELWNAQSTEDMNIYYESWSMSYVDWILKYCPNVLKDISDEVGTKYSDVKVDNYYNMEHTDEDRDVVFENINNVLRPARDVWSLFINNCLTSNYIKHSTHYHMVTAFAKPTGKIVFSTSRQKYYIDVTNTWCPYYIISSKKVKHQVNQLLFDELSENMGIIHRLFGKELDEKDAIKLGKAELKLANQMKNIKANQANELKYTDEEKAKRTNASRLKRQKKKERALLKRPELRSYYEEQTRLQDLAKTRPKREKIPELQNKELVFKLMNDINNRWFDQSKQSTVSNLAE